MGFLVLSCLLLLWYWLGYGLLPLRWQNPRLAGPDAALRRAYRAAALGRWEPAARLFEDAGQDWERRSLYAQRLGYLAARRSDRWLRAWAAARPDDPDAALVAARARVLHAWKLRGRARAHSTSRRQFEGFHRELLASQDDIARALALRPDDPTPLVAEIWRALGLGYPNREMRALWSEITVRAPHHFEAHSSALQYWTAKWRGSKRHAWEFAEKAAADAPPGSLLAVLPVMAWYENHADELGDFGFRSARVHALVDAALADVALADPGHPRLPEVRHLLAYFLYRQGRYRAAGEQFRQVDGFTEALPWRYSYAKSLYYRAIRTKTARKALTERRPR
ncbi:hypothetical protein CP967_32825 [Streptomyces nitrosporeus]|uniref:DUF4034 domain-containing protein n=1 Tax=Streptomyces nitrosporeus TaxID=28894 RepID=A0A5J6FIT5_9ACTN|nr:hypothetical protein [Streptomyces nitrosporeus]QEU76123.1 hypothetical protein CP967_32825 [Streptomyces nitrosporeus]GGZ08069.1 hypothetical protein GCM10010327_43170 [Streptomyces nitrosporeus]